MKKLVALALAGIATSAFAQDALLRRRYREGEALAYRMTGINNGRRYDIRATGVVKRDDAGRYFEEYAWSDFVVDGSPVSLPVGSAAFRQVLSLEPALTPAIPDLRQVPRLIGPITDLLTFYVDVWLATRVGQFSKAGDRRYHAVGRPASWADGVGVVLGEDSIDFDMMLSRVDESAGSVTLLVRHVPPKQPQIRLPAEWMREPAADTLNNWVNVMKQADGYRAQVGKETFDVTTTVSLLDGRILSGTLDNVVVARERDCGDAALQMCGPARPLEIKRHIAITLER